MSILSTSPTNTRHFDMNIASALGSIESAVILQQLHYWMLKPGVGTIIDGEKYVYNTFVNWVNQQFRWLSVWQFRKAMSKLRSLAIVKVIRYKSKQWNQTNYYSLDYSKLQAWASAQSIEIIEMCAPSSQSDETQTFKVKDTKLSFIESKSTNHKKETTKQFAAASPKLTLKAKEKPADQIHPQSSSEAIPAQLNSITEIPQPQRDRQETEVLKVDFIINKDWKSLIPLLDSAGVPINKTVTNLLKLYPLQKVENAIAIVRARKRESYIPNPGGYFVSALQGDWGSKSLVDSESSEGEIDQGAIFRHWYDLAKELGYCSGQEMRDGQQWVCLSGSWEKWNSAVNRGYSLEYLKKIMKRNQGQ